MHNDKTHVRFDHLSREQLDEQLSPSRSAKDAAGTLTRHAVTTERLQAEVYRSGQVGIEYGAKPAQKMDLYRPQTDRTNLPCFVFIHGGFWQEGDRSGSAFAAESFLLSDWAYVSLGYSLAPAVTLVDIIGEIDLALVALVERADEFGIDPGRIVVAGHSAGAHLVAAILTGMASVEAAQVPSRAILISGVYDLLPVAASYVNDALALSPEEAVALSPIHRTPGRDIPMLLLIGADETSAFRHQTAALDQAWSSAESKIEVVEVAGRDHFDILDDLSAVDSKTYLFAVESNSDDVGS